MNVELNENLYHKMALKKQNKKTPVIWDKIRRKTYSQLPETGINNAAICVKIFYFYFFNAHKRTIIT